MPSQFTLPEQAAIVSDLVPAADAAGRNGVAFATKLGHKVYLVAHINQGNAATILLTPQQCTDNTGATSKAIPAVPIWADQDCAASSALVRQADAANFTTDAGLKAKIVIFEIDPSKLDSDNGYTYLRLVTGASNAANITAAVAYLTPLRYGSVAIPSVLA